MNTFEFYQKEKTTKKKKMAETSGKKKTVIRDGAKKPLTPYMRYHQAERPKYDKTKMSFAEITRAVVNKWKALSEEEKAPFVEAYKAEAEQYKTVTKKGGRAAEVAEDDAPVDKVLVAA